MDNGASISHSCHRGGQKARRKRLRQKKRKIAESNTETLSDTDTEGPVIKRAKTENQISWSSVSPDKCVAIDCEMVGVGPKGSISALARCSIVDFHGNCLLDIYSKPNRPVRDFRTRYSGIRWRDIRRAPPFENARQQVLHAIQGKVVVGHAIENDLGVLRIDHPKGDIRDTLHHPWLAKEMLRQGLSCGLKKMAKALLDWNIQANKKGHNSIEDAWCTMELFKLAERSVGRLPADSSESYKHDTSECSNTGDTHVTACCSTFATSYTPSNPLLKPVLPAVAHMNTATSNMHSSRNFSHSPAQNQGVLQNHINNTSRSLVQNVALTGNVARQSHSRFFSDSKSAPMCDRNMTSSSKQTSEKHQVSCKGNISSSNKSINTLKNLPENIVALYCVNHEKILDNGKRKSELAKCCMVDFYGNQILNLFVKNDESNSEWYSLPFEGVQERVKQALKGKLVVVHSLHNSLNAISLEHPKSDVRVISHHPWLIHEATRRELDQSLLNMARVLLNWTIPAKKDKDIMFRARAVMGLFKLAETENERINHLPSSILNTGTQLNGKSMDSHDFDDQVVQGSSQGESTWHTDSETQNEYTPDTSADVKGVTEVSDLNESKRSPFKRTKLEEECIEKITETNCVALDCEFVEVETMDRKDNQRLGRCSIVDFHGRCILDIYAKPDERIVDYRTRISGLNFHRLDNALPSHEAQKLIQEQIQGKIIIGHGMMNDLKVLRIDHQQSYIRDTSRHSWLKACMACKNESLGLKKMAKFCLDWEIQEGRHSSLIDAAVTMELFKMAERAVGRLQPISREDFQSHIKYLRENCDKFIRKKTKKKNSD